MSPKLIGGVAAAWGAAVGFALALCKAASTADRAIELHTPRPRTRRTARPHQRRARQMGGRQ